MSDYDYDYDYDYEGYYVYDSDYEWSSDNDYNDYSSGEHDGTYPFKDNSHRRELIAMLDNQRKTGEYTDVVVKVAGMEFHCHRSVLAGSLFFKTMLSCKLAESRTNVIQLHEIDSISFSKILDFLYTGKIRITGDDVQGILQAAHMLNIDKIIPYCENIIRKNLGPPNCLGVIRLANVYDFSDLEKEGRDVAVSQFLEVGQHEEFLTLSTDELVDLLADKDLQIINEDDVVNSVIQWLDHDAQGRKASMPTIIQHIHLSHVRVSALEKLESHPVLREYPECLGKITAANEEHLSGTLREDTGAIADREGHKARSGVTDELAIIVGGWKAAKRYFHSDHFEQPVPLRSVICVNPDRKQCYHVTDLPTPVSAYMSATSVDRCLYVTGGRAHHLIGQGPHSAPSRQAFRYDFATDAWTELPGMPRGRAEHRSIIADEKLFLIGGDIEEGDGHGKSLLDIDCFDLKQRVWMRVLKMPLLDDLWNFKVAICKYRSDDELYLSWNFTVKALQGKVVVIEVLSGEVHHPEEDSLRFIEIPRVHAYDVKTGSWTAATSDVQLPDSLEFKHADQNMDILSIAVDDNLYFRVRSYDRHHYPYKQPNLYAYNVKENVLITAVENKEIFTDCFFLANRNSYVDGQNDIMDTMNMIYIDRNQESNNSVRIWMPFLLFGHSYIGTKKTSVGWYCRDLEKLGDEDYEFHEDKQSIMGSDIFLVAD